VAPYFVLIAIYLPARWHALGGFATLHFDWTTIEMIRTWPIVLCFYFRQLLWPFQYTIFPHLDLVTSWSSARFFLPLAAVIVIGLGLAWISRQSLRAAFCILLLLLTLAPVLNLWAFPKDDFLHDRYIYLPSAGLCLLAALGLRRLGPKHSRLQTGLALSLAGFLAVLTVRASPIWHDNFTMLTHAVQVAPASSTARLFLAGAFSEEGRSAEALPILKEALAAALTRGQEAYQFYLNIASCYESLGEYEEAAQYLEDAITQWPDKPGAYIALAIVNVRRNRLDEAEADVRRELLVQKGHSTPREYHYSLGRILEAKGNWQGALAEYDAELRAYPDAESAAVHAATLRSRHRAQ
jgi:tetratricopeptide (TPR) repeat protein